MEIKQDMLITLGYGKFVKSDRIVALKPIEVDRGPGRRTLVYVEGLTEPLVASRSEQTIVKYMTEVPDEVRQAVSALDLLHDLLDSIKEVGPMLRESIKREARLDFDRLEIRITELLNNELEID